MSQANTQHTAIPYPPIEQLTRPCVDTAQAAFYLNRQPQTMRIWACKQPDVAIRPIRINGRLAWRVVDILALLNGESAK